jgi:hypothetical protein
MKPFRFAGGRPRSRLSRGVTPVALLALSLALYGPAFAQTTYGTLSNFDVFNDTGEDCHGFEIELEDVSSVDVSYTFGAPYERYGNPTVEDDPAGARVFVRYRSSWDPATQTFTATTPMAPAVITPTNGHSCWTGGSGSYLTSGCEHFGLGLRRNPTRTIYRWLVADPANPGSLKPSGSNVSIPAPIWNVAPAPGGGQPIVQAVVPPEPPEVHAQYGEAQWVKVFKTEAPEPVELHHLLTDDPAVPQEAAETEIEWKILQAKPDGAGNDEMVNEGQVGDGNESVTRRYEFYEYTGAYDPENHEVMCGGDGGCDLPIDGELGNYIGAQMVALNLAPIVPPSQVDLTVSKAGSGSGSVASTPAGIDCGAACTAPFDQDSTVTLAETADLDSFFGGWGDACTGTDATADVTLAAAATCSATFHLLSESADLDVTVKQSPRIARAGRRIGYTSIVENRGPALAPATVLTVTLEGLQAADLATIKAPRKCAIAGAVVTCPLGDLRAGRKVRRRVSVKTSVAGTIDVTSTATSAAPSASPADATEDVSTDVQ